MTGILLTNAHIITLDERQPHASAIAIDQGRILAVGAAEALCAEFEERFDVEDLGGQVILPGLTDAHLHLQYYSLELDMVDCETSTRAECLRRLAERAQETPPGESILGANFNQNAWPEGAGDARDLDAVVPHNPVYIMHKSHHSVWLNTAALGLAGLSAATPDPAGGKLGRLPDGSLDGILYEDSAMTLATRGLPPPTVAQIARAIHKALPSLWQVGLTGVHDFDRSDCFAALQLLHQRGELKLRVLKSIPLDDLPHAAGLGLRSGFGNDMLRIGSIKAFMDGALGPQTAAMLEPYAGSTDDRGILILDHEQLYEHARTAADHGLGMTVHAIGDRAVHEVLDAFEHLRSYEREQLKSKGLRHRIEHVQLIHPLDAGRLAALDVIASMQPSHAPSDMWMAERYWGERTRYSYAMRTQLEAGARLALGSDAPVEKPNPFQGIHAAVTRRRADGSPGEQGWHPEQRLTLTEALHGFTSGAAYAAGMEDRLGRLAPGCLADLIVLEHDPFQVPPHDLQHLLPTATMVSGEWVYRK